MNEVNERFGVVDHEMREKYEKEFQVPYGYEYITFDKEEAIAHCKNTKGYRKNKFIVERIFNNMITPNNKEVIFRNEKNN